MKSSTKVGLITGGIGIIVGAALMEVGKPPIVELLTTSDYEAVSNMMDSGGRSSLTIVTESGELFYIKNPVGGSMTISFPSNEDFGTVHVHLKGGKPVQVKFPKNDHPVDFNKYAIETQIRIEKLVELALKEARKELTNEVDKKSQGGKVDKQRRELDKVMAPLKDDKTYLMATKKARNKPTPLPRQPDVRRLV
ncbi:TPA: hypothetical protein HA225_02390 [Candidatus Micrarchaeota archaeon]|nr:hypothetical protein [Candidatus Micrarchaeota archaeon]HIH30422.1 hypothetical protein [Candidatus Micrarchaeota archaeon]